MVYEIIKGISMALHKAFGDGCWIYQNDVRQGMNLPCFFLAVLKPELAPLAGRRYMSRNPFDVQYHPPDGRDNAEILRTAEELLRCLEFITLPDGSLLRGTGMNYEVVDNVLHFFVSYNLPMIKPAEEMPMETLETHVGLTKE